MGEPCSGKPAFDGKNVAIPISERDLCAAIWRVKEKYNIDELTGHALAAKLMAELKHD